MTSGRDSGLTRRNWNTCCAVAGICAGLISSDTYSSLRPPVLFEWPASAPIAENRDFNFSLNRGSAPIRLSAGGGTGIFISNRMKLA